MNVASAVDSCRVLPFPGGAWCLLFIPSVFTFTIPGTIPQQKSDISACGRQQSAPWPFHGEWLENTTATMIRCRQNSSAGLCCADV